jgi:GGDEF domain-containing protein
MSGLKRQIALLLIYLVGVFSLERLDFGAPGMLNLHPYAYALIVVAMLLTIIVPQLRGASVFILLILWESIYVVLWLLISPQVNPLTFANLQVTIVELILIATGVLIVHGLARHVNQLEDTIESIAFGEIPGRANLLEDATEAIKVELTRSRRYNRPLTVLVLEPDPEAIQSNLQRVFQEMKLNSARRYAIARLCQIVNETSRRTDLIFQQSRQGRFIVLCPETDPQDCSILANRIQNIAHESLGIPVAWGAAVFPADALTFEELLHKAELKLLAPTGHPLPAPQEPIGEIGKRKKTTS